VQQVGPNESTPIEPTSELQQTGRAATLLSSLASVLFLVVLFLINFTARIVLSPLLPTIESELGISHGEAGSFFLLISGGYLLGLLGSGFLASCSTHKLTIVISTGGVGLALLGISSATNLSMMRIGLLGLGAAAGLYIASAIATITSLVEQRNWGKAIAVHELAPNLAFFASPFVAELFLRWSTWRTALSFLGVTSLIASLAYYQLGRGGEFAGQSPASGALIWLTRMPAFWLMGVLFGVGVGSTIGVYAMLPLYLVSERQLEPSWANTVVAFSRSYGPILGVLGGWVCDKLGPKHTMVSSLTFTGMATFLLGPISSSWIGAVVVFQPLLAVWFFPAAFAALAAITPPRTRNLAVAFTVPFGYILGGGAIPTFIGIMGDAGSFSIGFIVTGALIFLSGLSALLLRLPAPDERPT
jgi:MFS transporter, NNP family, nitrate/nitrite transporter